MRRFFIPINQIKSKIAFITGSDAHHIINVLRKKEGDLLEATDGKGNNLKCKIVKVVGEKVEMKIIEKEVKEERKIFLRLYQALPKGMKIDLIVEKACELGVNEFVMVFTERTIPEYDEKRLKNKKERLERISLEVMKQTGRNTLMIIQDAIHINKINSLLLKDSLKIMPWEMERDLSLKSLLKKNSRIDSVELLIGPEGGFTIDEVDRMRKDGFITVSLGNRILKVETATIVASGNIYYELEKY